MMSLRTQGKELGILSEAIIHLSRLFGVNVLWIIFLNHVFRYKNKAYPCPLSEQLFTGEPMMLKLKGVK